MEIKYIIPLKKRYHKMKCVNNKLRWYRGLKPIRPYAKIVSIGLFLERRNFYEL